MDTDSLIDRLAEDGRPMKPAPKPGALLAGWLVLIALYLALYLGYFGIREDIAQKSANAFFLIELALCVLTITGSAWTAMRHAFPGMETQKICRFSCYAPFTGFLTFFGIQLIWPVSDDAIEHQQGMQCVMDMCLFSFLPAALLFLLLFRGIYMHPARAAFTTAIASGMTTYLALRIAESNDNPLHLLLFHLLPMLLMIGVLTLSGHLLTRWRTRRQLSGDMPA